MSLVEAAMLNYIHKGWLTIGATIHTWTPLSPPVSYNIPLLTPPNMLVIEAAMLNYPYKGWVKNV